MVTIESTPEMAAKVYETMERNLAIVRRRLGRPLTLADKVVLGHLDDPEHQEMEPGRSYLFLRPDRVVLQDVLGQTAMLQFRQTRRERVAVPTTIHCDHLIQARVEGERDLRESLAENQEVYDFLKSAAAKYGAGFWGPGAGIIHQVVLENYAFPGALIIGTDSHTPNAGGLGACSVGVGGADAVEVMAGLPWEVLYPRHIAVYLTGKLSGWTAPTDVEAHPEKYYDVIVELDLAKLEPHVVGPHTPDRARPIGKLAAEVADVTNAFPDTIASALIGSCTNSSYEDMSRAADVAEQAKAHGLKSSVPFLVTPGSEQVRATIERDGQMQSLKDINGVVLANACGPCIGQWRRANEEAAEPNTIVTSYNRNFPRRNDGQPTTMNFIGSPEIVTAFALAGRLSFNPLTDSLTGADGKAFKLAPPKSAPEVPAKNFDRGRPVYVAAPQDGSAIVLKVDPKSERLQLMEPWPAWDGQDFKDMPVLLKAKGKTTTDHISPAGSWLRYRGHLDKFSDNMFMGATNAYTGEAGKGKNVLTGQTGQSFSTIARDYKSKRVKWVVVGDSNYGEGSSREHAALSPRLLGVAAVIVRSFPRVHESNLKKQGLLALTFQNPADYDRIREDDRLSLLGLRNMAPGKPVECRIAHADGTTEIIQLAHTFAASQLELFP